MDFLQNNLKKYIPFPDPRTNDWFLIKSPIGLLIIFSYLYFVNSWGPKFMADRKPYKLDKVLMVYNFGQVLVSIYLVYEVSFIKLVKSNN